MLELWEQPGSRRAQLVQGHVHSLDDWVQIFRVVRAYEALRVQAVAPPSTT